MPTRVKSIQLLLNEWFEWLGEQTVINRAFTQARANLKHTTLISLNERRVEIYYEDAMYLKLPRIEMASDRWLQNQMARREGIKEEFGGIRYSHQQAEINGEHNYAQVSVLFEVLNRMLIAGEGGKDKAYEVDLAIKHLSYAQPREDL